MPAKNPPLEKCQVADLFARIFAQYGNKIEKDAGSDEVKLKEVLKKYSSPLKWRRISKEFFSSNEKALDEYYSLKKKQAEEKFKFSYDDLRDPSIYTSLDKVPANHPSILWSLGIAFRDGNALSIGQKYLDAIFKVIGGKLKDCKDGDQITKGNGEGKKLSNSYSPIAGRIFNVYAFDVLYSKDGSKTEGIKKSMLYFKSDFIVETKIKSMSYKGVEETFKGFYFADIRNPEVIHASGHTDGSFNKFVQLIAYMGIEVPEIAFGIVFGFNNQRLFSHKVVLELISEEFDTGPEFINFKDMPFQNAVLTDYLAKLDIGAIYVPMQYTSINAFLKSRNNPFQ